MMLNQESAPATQDCTIVLPSETVIVETRFGTYEFAPEQTIIMPRGLVGFADQQLFGLGNLPEPVPEDFKLLQSLDEPPISFIVTAMSADESSIEMSDLKEACSVIGFPRDEIHVMYICTLKPKESGTGIEMWVNLRAPILFDIEARQARQYVLSNSRYPLRHPLSKWNGEL